MSNRPMWALKACQILLEQGRTKKELAEQVGVSLSMLCSALTGYLNSPAIESKVREALKISNNEEEE